MQQKIASAARIAKKIEDSLQLKSLEDWYHVRSTKIKPFLFNGGTSVLADFDNSLPNLLKAVYPEHDWKPWKFDILPANFWKDKQIQKDFLNDLGQNLQIRRWEEWYRVNCNDIRNHGGQGLEKLYGRSAAVIISSILTEHPWELQKFGAEGRDYLRSENNQKEVVENIARSLHINALDDWYEVTNENIVNANVLRASDLLARHSYSVVRLVTSTYPNHSWDLRRFRTSREARAMLERLGLLLGVKEHRDWYRVQKNDLIAVGGQTFLNLVQSFNGSYIEGLAAAFPEHDWQPWRFRKVTNKYWTLKGNQRLFFDHLSKNLKIRSTEDWYKVSSAQIEQLGGGSLLKIYDGDIGAALRSAYPEHRWEEWRFDKLPKDFAENHPRVKAMIAWGAQKLGVKQLDDWYQVTSHSMYELGFRSLVEKFGGVIPFVAHYYPEHPFKQNLRRESYSHQVPIGKSHQNLFGFVQKIFEGDDSAARRSESEVLVHANYVHPSLVFGATKRNVEFDVFVPTLSLAFEYQGSQHYEPMPVFGSADMTRTDQEKKKLCAEAGITLIEIPFWWNETLEELIPTIIKHRGDLEGTLTKYATDHGVVIGKAISQQPPNGQLSSAKEWA
eukprot:TRINITY_DN3702_c0_g1_i1.p1 TRINITY_DN3702_c0_g1~~TRINITY_DN3702_c0_g1_i1.p1  ORF type:complete len:614 (+),score=148.50 TRINITY_DN3702_c0_g1_i1:97-1938(+)